MNFKEFREQLCNDLPGVLPVDMQNVDYEIPKVDLDVLNNYDQMKSMLSIQVVSTELNMDMLQNIPHKEIEDLSMVYRFVTGNDSDIDYIS